MPRRSPRPHKRKFKTPKDTERLLRLMREGDERPALTHTKKEST
jgi:hypothetical protein